MPRNGTSTVRRWCCPLSDTKRVEVDKALNLELDHEHVLADGRIIRHHHGHKHSHAHTKGVVNRLARLIGHLQSVKKMVEEGRDCSEVLVQLAAVDSALKGVSRVIIKDHMEHCIVDAVQHDDREALEELSRAIDSFIK